MAIIQQGMSQQSPAVQLKIMSGTQRRRTAGKRRRLVAKKRSASKKRSRAAGSRKRKSKLKFGSPAWQKKYNPRVK